MSVTTEESYLFSSEQAAMPSKNVTPATADNILFLISDFAVF